MVESNYSLENIVGTGKRSVKRFVDWYFTPKSWERWRKGKVYKLAGVNVARKILMGTVGKLLKITGKGNRPSNYFIGSRKSNEDIKEYIRGTRFNETVHGLIGVPMSLLGFLESAKKIFSEPDTNSIIISVLFLSNTYLIMMQRYNRARCYDVLEHREARSSRILEASILRCEKMYENEKQTYYHYR